MPDTTLIALTGRDTLDLLHRISTQALLDLAPGTARVTCFCDFRGRLLHRVWVARVDDGTVWLARPDAPAAGLLGLLDRSIFREDVRVRDRSAELEVAWRADGALAPGAVEERDGLPVGLRAASGPELVVVGPGALAATDVTRLDERARIEAGVAAHGHEIVEDHTPFEVNLGDAMHLDKGCFTGQEVLQRLVTHDSVRRRLYRVRGAGAPPSVPCEVTHGSEPVGRVTSAVATERGWVGLAVLAREPGPTGELVLAGGDAIAEARALPLARPLGRPWAAVD